MIDAGSIKTVYPFITEKRGVVSTAPVVAPVVAPRP